MFQCFFALAGFSPRFSAEKNVAVGATIGATIGPPIVANKKTRQPLRIGG